MKMSHRSSSGERRRTRLCLVRAGKFYFMLWFSLTEVAVGAAVNLILILVGMAVTWGEGMKLLSTGSCCVQGSYQSLLVVEDEVGKVGVWQSSGILRRKQQIHKWLYKWKGCRRAELTRKVWDGGFCVVFPQKWVEGFLAIPCSCPRNVLSIWPSIFFIFFSSGET